MNLFVYLVGSLLLCGLIGCGVKSAPLPPLEPTPFRMPPNQEVQKKK